MSNPVNSTVQYTYNVYGKNGICYDDNKTFKSETEAINEIHRNLSKNDLLSHGELVTINKTFSRVDKPEPNINPETKGKLKEMSAGRVSNGEKPFKFTDIATGIEYKIVDIWDSCVQLKKALTDETVFFSVKKSYFNADDTVITFISSDNKKVITCNIL
jgi:hypothetical protein